LPMMIYMNQHLKEMQDPNWVQGYFGAVELR
jgi:hypothetical protein